MDSYVVSLLDRIKEQYEQWEASPPLSSAELTRFFGAIGRAAEVIGRNDIAAEAERILQRTNRQKERQWTAEEALAEMVPLLRRCYEAEETDSSPITSLPQRGGPEAVVLLCGNDPLFFAYLRGSLQTVSWRFITLPSFEQAAASMFRLNPDCIIVDIGEDHLETPSFLALLENAGRASYIPVVIVGTDGRKAVHLKWYELGADDVVVKPAAAGELFIRVRRLVEKKRKIDELVLIDELTGVYNRKYLPRVYARLRSDLERSGTPSCLALLDLDHFKQVNDRFGHLMGDAVLKKLAAFLLQHTRGMDTVVRFGGEEFIVWLAKTSTGEARRVLRRLQRQFASEEVEADGARLSCTFSAGFVECDDPNEPLDHWLKLADKALYAAKRKGGNRVEEARRQPSHANGAQNETQHRQAGKQRWAVAIVDDDELARTVIADLVRKLAAEQEREVDIYEFGDGLSFLESPLCEHGRRFVVILDRVMPKMDGLEVLHRLRRRRTPHKVMMLTSRQDEREIADALEKGVDEYVTKPFKWLELEARLRRLLKELDE
ncbi:diguanylate cyclase [Geobacillus subterraneus]|uniref:Diguanylate cyclase n=2 Tax=Geobacillus TaxID=129337 RepID=A0ABM6AFZ6_9BACL|nr:MULTISPECIES: diguanylate cyclase [Geobacillus]AMX85308.1 diguanylate cyclase [Geobacillus subterraneus]KZS24468.1 diguanylate cyclase [Geobacillus subterraneus]OXB88405.1 diguanylate cyclase [Geobacillus uzenensis]